MGREDTLQAQEFSLGPRAGLRCLRTPALFPQSTSEDMKGNLLSPVRERVWGGVQAQLDSGVQMVTSVFYPFSALPSFSGQDYLFCFSQRNSWAGLIWGWCGSCDHL